MAWRSWHWEVLALMLPPVLLLRRRIVVSWVRWLVVRVVAIIAAIETVAIERSRSTGISVGIMLRTMMALIVQSAVMARMLPLSPATFRQSAGVASVSRLVKMSSTLWKCFCDLSP